MAPELTMSSRAWNHSVRSSALSMILLASTLEVRLGQLLLHLSVPRQDPGVGATTPPLSVFKSPVEAFEFYSTYPLNVNESISSFGRMFAQSQILGNLTVDRAEKIAESVSTPAVATDMLTITRAFGHEQVNYWGIS